MILARNFDTVGFAAYSYFQLTISMLTSCTAMGMGVTASRYFAEYAGRKNNDGAHPPLATLWLLSIFLAFVAGCIVLILPASIISPDLAVPRWLMALGVVVLSLNIVPAGGVLGLQRYRDAAVISGFSAIMTLSIVFYAASVGSPTMGMVAIVIGGLVQFLGQTVLIVREIGLSGLIQTFLTDTVATILGFAGPMFGVSILNASGTWIVGRIILSTQAGEYSFSLYVIGMQWFSLAMLLPGIFSRVVFPILVRYAVSEVMEVKNKSVKLLKTTSMASVGIASIATVFVALFSPWIIALYGPKYGSISTVIIAFSAIAILGAPANIIGNALVARNNQNLWLMFALVSSFILVASCYLTINMGVWSGVVSLALSSGTLTFLAFSAARSRSLI
jgi:O-antigen/teichoic acid export membrane protein